MARCGPDTWSTKLQTLPGEPDDDLAAVFGAGPFDEASLFEAINPVGHSARGHHRLADQLAGRELVRRPRPPKRGQHVVHPVLDAETGEVLGQPPVDQP